MVGTDYFQPHDNNNGESYTTLEAKWPLIIMEVTGATLLNTKISSQDLIAPLNRRISGTSRTRSAACTVSFNRALNQPEKAHKRGIFLQQSKVLDSAQP